MTEARRYHPLIILFQIGKLIRSSIIFIVYLFILNLDSESTYIFYGRIVFLVIFILSVFSIVLKWFVQTYQVEDTAFQVNKGLFVKSKQTIPFSKIQNVNRHTSFFHRLLRVTSIHFETGMNSLESAVEFLVISRAEANRLEKLVKQYEMAEHTVDTKVEVEEDTTEINQLTTKRTIHFTPTKKDTIKAAFTSLSFLVLVPVLGSLYTNIDDIFDLDQQAEGLFLTIVNSWWITTIVVLFIIVASLAYGIIRTFLKYGKYEISSDEERIFIKKGVLDETAFSIAKEKVQAVEVTQSFMKRILGLAEVKLTSTSNSINDSLEVNTLYPFLPIKRAYEMIEEMLPTYTVSESMHRLPKKSLWIRLIRPSWLWMIVTVIVFFWKPEFLGFDQFWWVGSIALFILVYLSRLLDYYNSRYVLNGPFIQFKTGGFMTQLFITKREKVITVSVSKGFSQRLFGLASIGTVNRANPVHHAGLDDVPKELVSTFYRWYANRREEVKYEQE